MKLLRLAALGAGAWWFLDPKQGAARRARALEGARGLAGRARALLEGSGLDLAPAGGERRDEGAPSYTAVRPARRPEVVEVKSPAELEPGAYSASPAPARTGRVDRSDLRGAAGAGHGALPGELEPTAEDWRNGDVTPRVDLAGPPQGSHVTEAHLGVYVPRDELEAPGRGLRASDDDAASETAGRREPE